MTRFVRWSVSLTLLLGLPFLAIACSSDSTGPPPVGDIQALNAALQGTAGGAVTLQVRIIDESGNPIQGIEASFAAASGSGSVSPGTASTGSDGTATTTWTLGTTAGNQSVTVTAGARSITVSATANPGPPAEVTLVSGGDQTGRVGEALDLAVTVRVTDAFGNSTPGANVVFSVASGGGSLSPTSATADANGQATTTWTLGPGLGTQTITVGAGSSTVTVAATAEPGAPASVGIHSGDAQVGTVATALANPLVVRVEDQFGNRVPGATVTFSASGDGSVGVGSVDTGSDGLASNTWTLGTTAGTQTLEASVSGAGSVTFEALAGAGAATTMIAVSGDGQTAFAGSALPEPIVVEVRDEFDNPVEGVSVIFDVTGGGGSATPSLGETDADGRRSVTWTLGNTTGTHTLEATSDGLATVTFTATASSGPPASVDAVSGNDQGGQAGDPLANPLVAEVRDGGGNLVQGATVTFVVTAGGGSVDPASANTGADGRASTMWTLGPTVGTQTVEARVSGISPAVFRADATNSGAATITKTQGDNQTATVGTVLPTPIQVEVLDENDVPVAGATVTFDVRSGGGSLSGGTGSVLGATLASTSVNTGASGRASVSWTLGGAAGSQTVNVQVVGLPAVTFSAMGTADAASQILLSRGDNQTATVGTPVAIPPQVMVTDQFGNPVGGSALTFTVTGGAGVVTGGSQTADANGLAAVDEWTLGGAAGANSIQVTGAGLTPLTMNATGEAQGATFDIEVRFLSTPTASQQQVFDNAEAIWESVITADIPDIAVNLPANDCGIAHPALNETIDDLVIFAQFDSLDGPGGTLAQAGPCRVRGGNLFPYYGIMQFDTFDLGNQLQDIIVHEMGHVLGFLPFVWRNLGLIVDENLPTTRFIGAAAIARFEAAGGTPQGAVPLEGDQGGGGTLDAHWDEALFNDELMTGFIDQDNPLSAVTAANFHDIGYRIDFSQVEAYSLPGSSLRIGEGTRGIHLREILIEPKVGPPDGGGGDP